MPLRIRLFDREFSWPARNDTAGQQLRLLIDGVTDYAIYMLDPNGLVTTWNAGAERIKGYRAKEIVGRRFSHFFLEEDRKAGVPARMLDEARAAGRF